MAFLFIDKKTSSAIEEVSVITVTELTSSFRSQDLQELAPDIPAHGMWLPDFKGPVPQSLLIRKTIINI